MKNTYMFGQGKNKEAFEPEIFFYTESKQASKSWNLDSTSLIG